MNKTDAIYARYSSHAQDDGTSIEVQLEQCERAAGGTCRHYIDRAKTGRAMGGRLQLLAMLADAEAGRIGRVFVYKFDRLGRDAETHVIARTLEEAGVELISATEGTNALARGIQLVVAEDYSRQLATRTRDGLIKRFEQGAFCGGVAPYGYRVETKDGRRVLMVDADEAAIVRDVAHQYLCESIGFKTIAKRLRALGVASRRGAGFSFTSVRCLLINPILTGRLTFNARRMQLNRNTGRRVARFRAETERLERQDEALRILDDETFAQVQEKIGRSGRREGSRLGRQVAPFSGLVYCGCGARCYRTKSQNAKGVYHYYACGRHQRYDDCTHNARVREDALVKLVQQKFSNVFKRADEIIAGAIVVARDAIKGNREAADRIKADLAATEAEQARGVELLVDRELSPATKAAVNRKMAEAEARRAELQASLDALREDANDNAESLAAEVRKVFDEARESLAAAATPEQYNRLVERFLGPMQIQADGTPARKQTPQANASGVLQEVIAGGGFEPPTSGL
jgi:site-specific DNA recombinase